MDFDMTFELNPELLTEQHSPMLPQFITFKTETVFLWQIFVTIIFFA